MRLIDETGKQVGVVTLQEALVMAQQKGCDLIQVTEKVDPPVCRLGDYGKYLYQQDKKDKAIKKPTGGGLKEIRLTFNISDHDLETRVKQAEKFLSRGDRVRIALPLRGRQKALRDHAKEKIEKFLSILNARVPAKAEKPIQQEPRGLSMIIGKQ